MRTAAHFHEKKSDEQIVRHALGVLLRVKIGELGPQLEVVLTDEGG